MPNDVCLQAAYPGPHSAAAPEPLGLAIGAPAAARDVFADGGEQCIAAMPAIAVQPSHVKRDIPRA